MNNERKKQIGQRINSLLAIRDIKQKELAKHLGVTDNTISYFCNGTRTPNTEQIIKIADFFNVSTDYLLGRTEIKSTDTTMQAVCNYTGLNEEVIQLLLENKNGDLPEYILPCLYANNIVMSLLNHLLSQRAFYMTISDLVNTARHITLYKFLTSDKDKSNAIVNLNNRFSEIFINDFNIDYVIDYEKKTIYEKFQQLIDTMINSYDVEEDDFLKGQIEHFADENYMPF